MTPIEATLHARRSADQLIAAIDSISENCSEDLAAKFAKVKTELSTQVQRLGTANPSDVAKEISAAIEAGEKAVTTKPPAKCYGLC